MFLAIFILILIGIYGIIQLLTGTVPYYLYKFQCKCIYIIKTFKFIWILQKIVRNVKNQNLRDYNHLCTSLQIKKFTKFYNINYIRFIKILAWVFNLTRSLFLFLFYYINTIDQILFSIYVGTYLEKADIYINSASIIDDRLDFSLLTLSLTCFGLGIFSYIQNKSITDNGYLETEHLFPEIPIPPEVLPNFNINITNIPEYELFNYMACYHQYFVAQDFKIAWQIYQQIMKSRLISGPNDFYRPLAPLNSNEFRITVYDPFDAALDSSVYGTSDEPTTHFFNTTRIGKVYQACTRRYYSNDNMFSREEKLMLLGKNDINELTDSEKEYVLSSLPRQETKPLEPTVTKDFALNLYRDNPTSTQLERHQKIIDFFQSYRQPVNAENVQLAESMMRYSCDAYIAYQNAYEASSSETRGKYYHLSTEPGMVEHYKYIHELHAYRAEVLKTIIKGTKVINPRKKIASEFLGGNINPELLDYSMAYSDYKRQLFKMQELYHNMDYHAHLPEMSSYYTHLYESNNISDFFQL